MISRLLFLHPGQLGRCLPFLLLYGLVFAALTVADGLSLTLFVSKAGAAYLPAAQTVASLCVLAATTLYSRWAVRIPAAVIFLGLLPGLSLTYLTLWSLLSLGHLHLGWLALLLVTREVAFALILLHFGAFLLDYFTREELDRVMPVIYAGGRFGGVLGGGLLMWGPAYIPVIALAGVVAVLMMAGSLVVGWLSRHHPRVHPHRLQPDPCAERPAETSSGGPTPPGAKTSGAEAPSGIVQLLREWPLLRWLTLATLVYFGCRALLTYRYSVVFEDHFSSEAELAAFLGLYAQLALMIALITQLLLVSRLVAWLGVGGTHLLYASIVTVVTFGGVFHMGLALAVAARFVEGELRYGLRNPVSQMIVNRFPGSIRQRARVWSLGVLIPLASILSAALLALGVANGGQDWVGVVAAGLALVYLVASLGLWSVLADRSGRFPSPHFSQAIPAASRASTSRASTSSARGV